MWNYRSDVNLHCELVRTLFFAGSSGNRTVFLQLQELIMRNITRTCSVFAALLSTTISNLRAHQGHNLTYTPQLLEGREAKHPHGYFGSKGLRGFASMLDSLDGCYTGPLSALELSDKPLEETQTSSANIHSFLPMTDHSQFLP